LAEPSDLERDLKTLEEQLRRLESEYTMFFTGQLPRPPHQTRARVDTLVRRLDRVHIPNYATRFRFTTLQSRYTSLTELWERAMRAREEGRPGPFSRGRAAAGSPATATENRVVHVAALSDPRRETDKVRALYDRLAEARRETGEPPIPFSRFAELVSQQMERLGAPGSPQVAFRVAVKDGKVSLTARPMRTPPA
jgi:hypothetical protein